MEPTVALVLALGALVAGVVLGWWLASRSTAPLTIERDQLRADAEGWRVKFNEAVVNLAGEAEKTKRADALEAQLATEREAASALRADVATLRSRQEERDKAFEQQIATLKDARDSLSGQFQEIAGKLLGDARKSFLEQAGEKFIQTVTPVEALLKSYQEKLQTIEKERVDHYAGLREAVDLVRTGQGQVRDETRNLVNALRSAPKTRGRWGEQSLRNVLVQSGLVEGIDFAMEVSVTTDDGRLRPDAVVNLPSDRKLIIDAKCSLNAYLEACEEVDEVRRTSCFKAHVASIARHAQQLGSKAYWSQFGDAADYVIMYIPGEHFLTAALEQDPELWEKAFKDRVLLATPTNLVAIARTVASVWRQEKLAEAASEIASLGKELHSRLATMNDHMARVGKNLATANSAYNQMVGSFESQVLTQAKRFDALGAGSNKALDPPPMVEVAPRPLTKLGAKPSNDEPPQIAAE
ncbi:DNA recombination protein RmuC [Sphingomonas sp.]|uniref:DNA recombination protein RmuC n=1 Tax=Sphingomonas sp. TaxID=28214 RepID=UPI0025EAA446|nr:DNA recombination protein RmuC [Sphingomonas sp.]MBV9527171.1 DNA recombination protein RmuC [Sphingomonas sp.]